MKYAGLLAKDSAISSKVVQLLQKDKRGRNIYQQLTRSAMRLIKEGLNKDEFILWLKDWIENYKLKH